MGSNLDRIRGLKKQKEILENVQANTLQQDFPPIGQTMVTVPVKESTGVVINSVHTSGTTKPKKKKDKTKTLSPVVQQQPKQPKKQKPFIKSRLPDGALFTVKYSAETETWKGELTIPNCPTFGAIKSGVFTLLTTLDKYFRDWDRKEQQRKSVDIEPKKGECL